jgi:hypothetical protein
MNMVNLALQGAWKVLLAGLVLGAGLPALYAFAVRGLAIASGKGALEGGQAPRAWGKVLAWVLLAVILLAVSYGLTFIIATGLGKTISFEHIYPTIVSK